ncbi:MAG: hypothetical protein ACLP66_03765 [Polyangia bacterium]
MKNPPLAVAATSTPEDTAHESAPGAARQPTAEGRPQNPALVDASAPGAVDKEPDTKERRTLLKIALALLQEHKSIDINDPSKAADRIVALANKAKISLKPSAVYRHLKIAQSLLPTTSPASLPEGQAPTLPSTSDKKD